MRRTGHILLRVGTVLSVLLLLVTLVLWARAQWAWDQFGCVVWIGSGPRAPCRRLDLFNYRGSMSFRLRTNTYDLSTAQEESSFRQDCWKAGRLYDAPHDEPEATDWTNASIPGGHQIWGFRWQSVSADIPAEGYVSTFNGHRYVRNGIYLTSVALPTWFLAMLFSVLPANAIRRWRRRARKHRAGTLCPTCGYDLRASPDRCPECGYGQVKPRRSDPLILLIGAVGAMTIG